MARIRTVKPEFWTDEKIGRLKRDVRLLFIGLWNIADDQGVIKNSPAYIKGQLFSYDDDLRIGTLNEWLASLVNARMLIPFIHQDESYLLIRTFNEHQLINRPSKAKFSEKTLSDLRNNTHGVFTEYSQQEGNGREGNGGESPPNFTNKSVTYDVETELLKNQIALEKICISAGKDIEFSKLELRKYHLFLSEKERYPIGILASFSGFEKWLLNSKNFTSSLNIKKDGSGTTSASNKADKQRNGIDKLIEIGNKEFASAVGKQNT